MFALQTYQPSDLGVIAFLVLLEGLLSADNALIMALMVKHLRPKERKKALTYGLVGAFIFRGLAILLATQIIAFWWLQAIGAGYLLFIAIKHLVVKDDHKRARETKGGFWQTVLMVELADIAFAVDSVIAAVAMVKGANKIWIVYAGAVIGIILLRFAASMFSRLIESYPSLEKLAYVIVLWVGIKLSFMAGHNGTANYAKIYGKPFAFEVPEMQPVIFWVVMAILVGVGTWLSVRAGRGANPEAGKIRPDGEEA